VGAVAPVIEDRHAIVLRMFNNRSSEWEVTDERIDALAAIPRGLEKRHAETFADMVDSAVEGIKGWGLTTERFTALQQYIALINSPTPQDIRDVIQQAQLGALRDGVADREWFVNAVKLLQKLEGEKPSV